MPKLFCYVPLPITKFKYWYVISNPNNIRCCAQISAELCTVDFTLYAICWVRYCAVNILVNAEGKQYYKQERNENHTVCIDKVSFNF
jgi:hypothetical protein